MRVNARFEGVAEKQVEYLATVLDTSISEVLRLSVDQYYTALRGQNPRELRFLSKHIGKSDSGRSDLSVNYKAEFSKLLAEKYKLKP